MKIYLFLIIILADKENYARILIVLILSEIMIHTLMCSLRLPNLIYILSTTTKIFAVSHVPYCSRLLLRRQKSILHDL